MLECDLLVLVIQYRVLRHVPVLSRAKFPFLQARHAYNRSCLVNLDLANFSILTIEDLCDFFQRRATGLDV